MVGPELFWPQDDNKQPYWPNLTYFHLTYAASTPSGEWLFERDPRCPEYNFDRNPENLYMRPPMDDAPQDEFPDDYRTAPSPILNRLYIAAAYAARHMPKLETMSLVGQVQAGLNGLLGQNILQCEIKHEFYYEREQGRVSWNIVENDSTRPNIVQNTG
ncbi:hypothetical protein EYZ11_013433 [Aspergillus tanneri]|uniref:Uncharacterized protein n=1 Tax=Aspergillus tanneri TaxID=1220188 RepID=A0A4S3J339_9EURO|nr:hypothetical protein EYZ11_013433 [Aspergillus tanneri]